MHAAVPAVVEKAASALCVDDDCDHTGTLHAQFSISLVPDKLHQRGAGVQMDHMAAFLQAVHNHLDAPAVWVCKKKVMQQLQEASGCRETSLKACIDSGSRIRLKQAGQASPPLLNTCVFETPAALKLHLIHTLMAAACRLGRRARAGLDDADAAIAANPDWMKGYYFRCAARHGLLL